MSDELQPKCVQCNVVMTGSHIHKKYCSSKCKGRWWRKNAPKEKVTHHSCRMCGKSFSIGKGQHNKWICSDKCRRDSQAKSVREFYKRRPEQEAIYRARTRKKLGPDSNVRRFYIWNPNAPRECQSCGEKRVLEIAHKPGYERHGSQRLKTNSQWPLMVWVLCPTCHRLLDRMNYSPQDLGLL